MNFTQELKTGLARMDIPYNVENGGTHDKLLLDVRGKTVKFPIPKTPSDHRAAKNCLSDIKRLVGHEKQPVNHIKISRTAWTAAKDGCVRISLPRAVIRKMFNGLPDRHEHCRFDANFNKTSKRLLIEARKNGRRNFVWSDKAGKKPESLVAAQQLKSTMFDLKQARVKGEEYPIEWVTATSFCVTLPADWWRKNELPRLETPKLNVPIDRNADAKAVVGIINDVLEADAALRVKVSADGRKVTMVKIKVIEEEL